MHTHTHAHMSVHAHMLKIKINYNVVEVLNGGVNGNCGSFLMGMLLQYSYS